MDQKTFEPEADLTPSTQSATDLPIGASTSVKDRITAINTKSVEDQSTVHPRNKPVVPCQKRLKIPTFVTTTHNTDELQTVFDSNKRSSKDLDSADFEDYVQQSIQKQ